jgi:hypothetical protein
MIGLVKTPEALPNDIAALKRIVADMARDAVSAQVEIARLKFQLARYRRAAFGRSSEQLGREAEPLELAIETLETDQAARLTMASPEAAGVVESAPAARGGGASRRPRLPELRRRVAADRRGHHRDPRLRAGPLPR